MRYSGIQQIQLDIARYARIQLDTVYSGLQRDTVDLLQTGQTQGYSGITRLEVRYRQNTGDIQAGDPNNTRQGRASIRCDGRVRFQSRRGYVASRPHDHDASGASQLGVHKILFHFRLMCTIQSSC